MSSNLEKKCLWIGIVEVRSIDPNNELLGDAKGAFVNVVTWASGESEYRHNVELLIKKMADLFIVDMNNIEPVEEKKRRTAGILADDVDEIIFRAEANPNAIIYGTFHKYLKDDA